MSRYTYLGPMDLVEIDGQQIGRFTSFDASNDEFIEDLRRRGFHLFQPGDAGAEPAAEPAAEEAPAEPAPEPAPEEAPPA